VTIFSQLGIDAMIVSGGTNRRYFSGWSAEDHAADRPSGVMLVTPDERTLFASPTNLPWAQAEALPGVETAALTGAWTENLASVIRDRGLLRVGFEDVVLPVAAFRGLESAIAGAAELVPVGPAIDDLRRVKDDREIGLLRNALRLTDEAFAIGADALVAGMTELALARIIQEALRDVGSEGEAFPIIVASGPNAARPHHAPGDRTILDGEPVIIDMGARVNGYVGDLTRTIWTGQPDQQLGTMYRLVADAQKAAFSAIAAGVPARDVDRVVRDVFARAGLEEHFVHGLGHGIGLRIHESPFMGQTSDDVLAAGNVVTVEPGLYIPGWGGVRIEDVVLVQPDGYVNLTGATKLLDV